jgi:hypothetical protein
MRSAFKYSIASVLAILGVAALVAGSALAEVKTAFSVTSAITSQSDTQSIKQSSVKVASSTDSGLRNEYESDVNLSGSADNVTARVRLRVRENSASALATHRSDIYWQVNDMFKLGFWGRGFGTSAALNAYFTYTVGFLGAGMTIGDAVAFPTSFSDRSGIDAAFKSGDLNFGVYLLDSCVPSCTWGSGFSDATVQKVGLAGDKSDKSISSNLSVSAGSANMSIVPNFFGKFGDLSVGAFYSIASGAVAGTEVSGVETKTKTTSVSANALDASVRWVSGPMQASFEFSTTTTNCDKKLLGVDSCDATTGSNIGLGFRFDGVQVHYISNGVKTGLTDTSVKVEASQAQTEISAAYVMGMTPNFSIAPMFSTRSVATEVKAAGVKVGEYAHTQTLIGFGGKASF